MITSMEKLRVGLVGEKKQIQLVGPNSTHRAMQIHSTESGLTQSEVIDLVLRMIDFRAELAKRDLRVNPETTVSHLETFILVMLKDAGLLSENELQGAMGAAELGRLKDVGKRLQYLFDNVNERVDMLGGYFQERRAAYEEERRAFLERNPDDFGIDRDVEFA